MTAAKFEKYCKRNKPTKIIPTDDGITFHFKVRVVIQVTNGIDGLIYSKWRKYKKDASKALIADLSEAAPMYFDNLKRKYGQFDAIKLQQLNQ